MLSPRKLVRTLAVFSVCATGVLIAGCEAEFSTGGDQIDEGSAEITIKRQYNEKYPDLKLTSIDCETTEAKVDNTFTCTAANDNGISLDIEATITTVDESSDSMIFDWTITKAVTDGTAYEEPAVKALRSIGNPVASVKCGEFEIVKGDKVDCEATMEDGSTETAVFTLTDGNGAFEVKLAGETLNPS